MNTVAIDTHKTVRKLMEKGFSEEQAEGVIDVLTESELVTKSDLKVALAEQTTTTVKWVAALLLAQAGLITCSGSDVI